jgi:hypothetical protein
MSTTNGTATIAVQIPFNLALLEYQSQITLERYGLSIEGFKQADLVTAWTKAVQIHLEHLAEDTDHFLSRNGNEEVFLDALGV